MSPRFLGFESSPFEQNISKTVGARTGDRLETAQKIPEEKSKLVLID